MDPKQRLSAGDAIHHVWFKTTVSKTKIVIDKNVLDRLGSFKGVSKLKKAAMNMLVKMADQNEIEKLRSEFVKLDKDCTGMINAEELKIAIQESDMNIPHEQID